VAYSAKALIAFNDRAQHRVVMADFTEQNQANRRSLHVPGRAAAMHYVIALVLVAIALAVRLALQPLLESEAPFLFFVPAVLAATGLVDFSVPPSIQKHVDAIIARLQSFETA